MNKGKLLSIGSNPKINKSDKAGKGFKTAILHLSPHKLSGKNFCANASPGCIDGCLNTSGHGRFDKTQEARLRRSYFFNKDRSGFLKQLIKEVKTFERHCEKRNLKPAIRLNGTSDIPWENIKLQNPKKTWSPLINIFEYFPGVQFYDYTKSKKRALDQSLPFNYHITFSRSEKTSNDDLYALIKSKVSCCVVFKKTIPKTFEGFLVFNGDKTDLRFLDPQGFIIGVLAKGKAKKDQSGFVIQN